MHELTKLIHFEAKHVCFISEYQAAQSNKFGYASLTCNIDSAKTFAKLILI